MKPDLVQPEPPPAAEPSHWTTRLQNLGRCALTFTLFSVFALWLHELFVDPALRQAWQLEVLLVLIPLALLGLATLLLAWLGQPRRKR